MIKSILVGINGTQYSHAAGEYARDLAARHGAGLVGLGVVDVPGLTAGQAVPLGAEVFKVERDAALLAESRKQIAHALKDFQAAAHQRGMDCRIFQQEGAPAAELALRAQSADLLVIGTRTTDPKERLYNPSDILRQAATHSPCPMIVAPQRPASGSAMLIAWDGSLQAARTLHALIGLGLASSMKRVVLLHVNEDRKAGDVILRRAADYLQMHGIEPELRLVQDWSPGQAIERVAVEIQAGLIVMGAYGKMRISELFFGSATRHLLRNGGAPLLMWS